MIARIGEQVRINSGEHYGQVGPLVGMDGSLYLVRIQGQTEHVSSILPLTANNGD